MTEKRFEIDLDEEAITDNGEYCLSLYCFQDKGEKDVCDLLNQLNDENEQLKEDVERCRNNFSVLDEVKCEIADENEQLKHNNKMLSMKMSEVSTKYRLLKEFSEDTNPNDAVKRVLSELMQITKEYR